jgi:hypothetical protein
VTEAQARYFGADLDERTFVAADDAQIAQTRLDHWLAPSERNALTYSIRSPLIARAMTSCWICSVPSKMS